MITSYETLRLGGVLILGLALLGACELKLDGDDDDGDAAVERGESTAIGNPDLRIKRDGGMEPEEETSEEGDGGRDEPGTGDSDGDGEGDRASAGGSTDGGAFMPDEVEVVDADMPEACDRALVASATQVVGRLDGGAEWSGVVHVSGDVSLRGGQGTTLTIAAGTTVFVDPGAVVEVGWNSGAHSIVAEGTEDAPVRFCRADDSASWGELRLGGRVLSSSVLSHVLIEGAGASGHALTLGAPIKIDHVWVTDSAAAGVSANGFRSDSQALTVMGSAGSPLTFTSSAAIDDVPAGSGFGGNGEDVAHVTFSRVDSNVRFSNIGIPYQLDVGLSVRNTIMFEVDPGVEFRVGVDQLVELGWNSSSVEFHLDGTEEDPIVFRGADERRGAWRSLTIRSGVRTASTLKHVQVMHAGGGEVGALYITGSVHASDVILKDNATYGINIGGEGLGPESGPFTVTGTEGIAGIVHPAALTSFPGGTFVGNESDYLEVVGGTIGSNGTVPALDVPYRFRATVDIRQADVTIEAGAEFEMQNDVLFDVGWNGNEAKIIAVGTEESPIVFRGVVDEPGFWRGVAIQRNVSTDSRLEHVHFSDGGGGANDAGILVLRAPVDVKSCTFSNSSGFGLRADADFNDYMADNTFENNAAGAISLF
ncbi:MAG: hypothetical protein OXU20_12120 [Myxococcales bacterium]|nr:hypothetical protein [Myxococcales bacterium]